jgi:hypothetical protein
VTEFKHPYWGRQFESLAAELSKLCIACDIDILKEGVGERILENDEFVCGRRNPAAFAKARHAVMAFYEVEEKAILRLGPEDVRLMLNQVRVSIAKLRGVGLDISPTSSSSDNAGES